MSGAATARAVSDLGDPAVILGLAVCLLAYYRGISRALATRWLAAVGLCGAAIALLKVALYADGHGVAHAVLASPSGHVAGSALIYGAAFGGAGGRPWRTLCLAVWCCLVGAIAISRLILHLHTGIDLLVGLVIGCLCLAWFARAWPAAPGAPQTWRVAAVCLLLGCGNSALGVHLPVDLALQALADRLTLVGSLSAKAATSK